MYRVVLFVPLCFLLTACSGATTHVSSAGCTIHDIPGDPNKVHAAFHQSDGKYDHIVLTYGRKDVFQADPDKVFVDGVEVKVPGRGGVYVMDKARTLHKTSVAADDLHQLLWSGNATDLPDSKAWKDELYPKLKAHAW